MLTRPLLLISLALLVLGCARAPVQTTATLKPGKTVQNRAVAAFNNVFVQGRVNVSLHTGYKKPAVILRGDARDLAFVSTTVKNNTLMVNVNGGYPKFGAITAEIRSHFLNSFTYNGGGTITGSHINSSALDLSITNPGRTSLAGNIYLRKLAVNGPGYVEINGVRAQNLQLTMTGNPRVKLAGMANLTMLNLDGEGWLGMYWVKSDALTIRAKGKTFVQLAGIANLIDVELWGNARFNGRYLRSKRTFVKTHDKSVAEIATLDRQHTLATDASDIYFYNLPETKADFMAYNGAVLDMRDWSYDMQEYTPYNK